MTGILFTIGAFVTKGYVSVGFVAALGLANALMWPAIFPLAIKQLGRFTERGSALLIMGIAGGAVIPLLFGYLKAGIDFQLVFLVIMLPCYLYILYYAVEGYKIRKQRD
jgi:fucose permease